MTDPSDKTSANESNTAKLGFHFYLMLGIPTYLLLVVLPFWDDVGRWPPLLQINEIFAPKVAASDYPLRRVLTGAVFLNYVEIIAIFMMMVFSRSLRKGLFETYDVFKFRLAGWGLSIFFVSSAAFTWVSFFVTDDFLSGSGRSALGRLVLFIPVFIGLGECFALMMIGGLSRDAWRKLRSILKLAPTTLNPN
ncbi:hypothetical protein [Methylocystis sp. Sn-Cys]|uniref:hypothetical protein n=1 Tax=Methylocystis sp. Sn-Cys TaxID=1701263 RepID=UPI001923B84E|nr:hypothetical protein [Methylocystis sp. Sn-Cys]MBL1256746.1 hypothetical protein [Methylocystis sp. Sn-Cys]